MRIPAHLMLSRHHVFYLRWPIPPAFHPQNKRTDIKLSLCTREIDEALRLGRQLCYLGDMITQQGAVSGMRYDEIRAVLTKHFSEQLRQRKADIAADGPLAAVDIAAFENSASVAEHALMDGRPVVLEGNDDILLQRFIGVHSLPLKPSSPLYPQLRKDFAAAFRDYCRATLTYNSSLAGYDYSSDFREPEATAAGRTEYGTLKDAAEGYFRDSKAGDKWTSKTEGERSDHLALLYEVLGENADIASVTKLQARNVKDLLMKLPKNRHKRKETRGLSLDEAIANAAGQTLDAVTVNKYIQTYSGLFSWALRNDYVTQNIFEGLAIQKGKRKVTDSQRHPFNDPQMALILDELVSNTVGLIGTKKPWRKWGPLIAAFTGARLNEIAQLEVADIKCQGQIDYFDINDNGEWKSLKAPASKRLIPIHSKLIELGFMEFVNSVRDSQSIRLFPDFSYSPKNGWGRQLSHWFNQVFLPKMGIKEDLLVFHSFRHSAVDKFNKAGVQEPLMKCVIGHEQAGVTQRVYGKGGFTLSQLRDTVEVLDYKIGG